LDTQLQNEAQLRDQSLTSTLEKFQVATILLARSTEISNLIFDPEENAMKRAEAATTGELAMLVAQARAFSATTEETRDKLQLLEAMTGLRNIRVIRKGDLVTTYPPSKTPPALIANGKWRAARDAAFHGSLGRAHLLDEDGNPFYFFFAPIFRNGSIPGVVVSEAPLSAEQSSWSSADVIVEVNDAEGRMFMSNSSTIPDDVQMASHSMNHIQSKITTMAPKPGAFGPYIYRSIVAGLIAILGYLMWDQQRERRKVSAQLAEAQQFKAAKLEDEVRDRTTELGAVKDQLALNESLALMGQVSESIGQEIYQPLAAIKNYAEVAKLSLTKGNTELAEKNIANLSGVTDRISRIIANLRGFVTTEASEVENLNIQPLVHDTAVNMLDRYPNLTRSLFLQVPNNMPEEILVLADRQRLEQVITGALASAWESARDEDTPKVIIGLKENERSITIHVDHNGTPANLNSDPNSTFARLRTSGDQMASGTSLAPASQANRSVGFTISKSFMEGMGGKMQNAPSKLGGERIEILVPKIAVGA
jgi:C4-dicarboxylate-specific signal transduction histidine kinase